MNREDLEKLSVIELKELLHKKRIECVGIFEPQILIELLLGQSQGNNPKNNLPPSYLHLFDQENSRNEEALLRIKKYLEQPQPKKPQKVRVEKVDRIIISNMPSHYSRADIEKFLSRAGLINGFELSSSSDSESHTQIITVQYSTRQGAKRCREMFNHYEVAKGVRLIVEFEQERTIKSEIKDLTDAQLTVVKLLNLFTEENCQDRQYMKEMREDVEQQAQEYGTLTGIAINESDKTVMLRYSDEKEALACVSALNGHLFDGRKIQAELTRDESSSVDKKSIEDALLSNFLASIAKEEAKHKSQNWAVFLIKLTNGRCDVIGKREFGLNNSKNLLF